MIVFKFDKIKINRHYKRLYLVIILTLSCLTQGISQEGEKLGSWYVYNGFFKFSPKFELFAETQIRTWEPVNNIQNFFIRPFFNFNINKSLQLGISQEYHMSKSYADIEENKIKTEEYRVTLQGMLYHKINRVSIQHRYRYEFRFLDESGKRRTRYRLQLGIPITKDAVTKGVWFVSLGNEFMINTKPEFNMSQNRAYGMLGYQFSKSTNFQFGYMYISHPDKDNLHRLQFFITQKFKFYD